MTTKPDMEKLGEVIAEEWMNEILTYYCKKHRGGMDEILKYLVDIDEKGITEFAADSFEMVKRENVVDEVINMGYRVEGN